MPNILRFTVNFFQINCLDGRQLQAVEISAAFQNQGNVQKIAFGKRFFFIDNRKTEIPDGKTFADLFR